MKQLIKLLFSTVILLVTLTGCDKEKNAPSCIISSPANLAEFDIGNNIKIYVDTYNPDDSPLEVIFYANEIEIGRTNTIPYTFEWNTVNEKAGMHLIKAKAKNDKGSTISEEIEIRLVQGVIPNVEVDIFRHLYSPPVHEMQVGETILVEGGYSGIIVYRDSIFYFTALDRTCTLWPDHSATVVPSPILAFDAFVCPECNSLFSHQNQGEVISGPAEDPLVRYKAEINKNTLYISN